jgi:translation elongation factor EF-G
MIRERLGANPVPIQLPIGMESAFAGAIDLLTMQAVTYGDETGAKRQYGPIPAELAEAAQAAHDQMIEAVAETDDGLLHKYLEGQAISEAELRAALRSGTIAGKLNPVLCGSSLRNKGVQPLLDAVVEFLPSPLDVPPVSGIHPHRKRRRAARATRSRSRRWCSRSPTRMSGLRLPRVSGSIEMADRAQRRRTSASAWRILACADRREEPSRSTAGTSPRRSR